MRYPYELIALEDGKYMTRFPDVPEALGQGDTREDAMEWAEDCLLVALSFYMDAREPVPTPSTTMEGHHCVDIPPMAAMKICIHNAMLEEGVSQLKLASRLHTDPKSIRRLLDLDHKSRFDHLEMALETLGYKVAVDIQKSGRPNCFQAATA